MKVFDQYLNREPISVLGEYGHIIAVIPVRTRGCINRVPTHKYPNPCIEFIYDGQWYSVCVKRDILEAQKGNRQVQQLMALYPVIGYCLKHTEHNIRPEISAVHSALNEFFVRVHDLRFLPPSEMKQSLGAIRQRTEFRDRVESWYGDRREDHRQSISYDVSLGHYEYLLRRLDHFLATGILDKQLCWFLAAHRELAMRDKSIPCSESASQMACRVATEHSAILVAQEKMQKHPYPLRYAAYVVSELIHHELFLSWYSYRDISYEAQESIARESLVAAGYQEFAV